MERNFNTKEASEYLKKKGCPGTSGTLEVWRSLGKGPRFKRIRKRVYYTTRDLDEFAEGETVETSDSRGI